MTPEELQAAWADQPGLKVDVTPGLRRRPQVDFAVPTVKFDPAARPRSYFVPLVIAVAASVLLVALAGIWKFVGRSPPARTEVVPVAVEIEDSLAECRSWSNTAAGAPDFALAEQACKRAISLGETVEAKKLLTRIELLRKCDASLKRAIDAEVSRRGDESLLALKEIGPQCETYLVRARALGAAAVRRALPAAKTHCETAGGEGCTDYFELLCQTGRLESDPLFQKQDASTPVKRATWRCPAWTALRPAVPPRPAFVDERNELAVRYANTELLAAALDYFDGNSEQAMAALEKESSPRAAEFSRDLRAIRRLLLEAMGKVQRGDDLALAAKDFEDLLSLDSKWMRGPDEKVLVKSEVRRSAMESISRGAYERGKRLADVKDFRGACLAWKLGGSFDRSNLDLLKALINVCTKKAASAYETASTCEGLDAVLDFAVDGDGYRERIDELKRDRGCR